MQAENYPLAFVLLKAASTFPEIRCPDETYYTCNDTKRVSSRLPSKIGASHILDLQLLRGHLDKENERSPILSSVLQTIDIRKDLSLINAQLLLAGHGFGKSKAIFDLARERYLLLFDCIGRKTGTEYVMDTFKCIDEVMQTEGDKMRNEVEVCFYLFVKENFFLSKNTSHMNYLLQKLDSKFNGKISSLNQVELANLKQVFSSTKVNKNNLFDFLNYQFITNNRDIP